MKVKALVSFSGIVTMTQGDIGEIKNKEVYQDLLRAKYVEEVKGAKKKVSTNEN